MDLPEIERLTINDLAFDVLRSTGKLVDRSFSNPTPYTKRAFYVKKATRGNLVATVERKRGQRGKHYLEVQQKGGPRPLTGLERLLVRRLKYSGIIGAVVPTKGLRRNRYGNIPGGTLNRILSNVQAQGDRANNTTANSRKRSTARRRAEYFVPRDGSKLSAGVYERRGKKIRKVLAFSDAAPRYAARFPMEANGRVVVEENHAAAAARAFRRVMAGR